MQQTNFSFLTTDFSLTTWMHENSIVSRDSFSDYQLWQLLEHLGIAGFMASDRCTADVPGYFGNMTAYLFILFANAALYNRKVSVHCRKLSFIVKDTGIETVLLYFIICFLADRSSSIG